MAANERNVLEETLKRTIEKTFTPLLHEVKKKLTASQEQLASANEKLERYKKDLEQYKHCHKCHTDPIDKRDVATQCDFIVINKLPPELQEEPHFRIPINDKRPRIIPKSNGDKVKTECSISTISGGSNDNTSTSRSEKNSTSSELRTVSENVSSASNQMSSIASTSIQKVVDPKFANVAGPSNLGINLNQNVNIHPQYIVSPLPPSMMLNAQQQQKLIQRCLTSPSGSSPSSPSTSSSSHQVPIGISKGNRVVYQNYQSEQHLQLLKQSQQQNFPQYNSQTTGLIMPQEFNSGLGPPNQMLRPIAQQFPPQSSPTIDDDDDDVIIIE